LVKNGSFGFACVSACAVRAKPNVPFVRLVKIVFKKVRLEKNKKHRVGNEFRTTRFPFVISFLCRWSLVKMVYFLRLIVGVSMVVVSFATLAPNVLALGEEADFEALNCLPALNLIRSTKVHSSTEPAFLPNACYALVLF